MIEYLDDTEAPASGGLNLVTAAPSPERPLARRGKIEYVEAARTRGKIIYVDDPYEIKPSDGIYAKEQRPLPDVDPLTYRGQAIREGHDLGEGIRPVVNPAEEAIRQTSRILSEYTATTGLHPRLGGKEASASRAFDIGVAEVQNQIGAAKEVAKVRRIRPITKDEFAKVLKRAERNRDIIQAAWNETMPQQPARPGTGQGAAWQPPEAAGPSAWDAFKQSQAFRGGVGSLGAMLDMAKQSGIIVPGVSPVLQANYWKEQFIGQEMLDKFANPDPERRLDYSKWTDKELNAWLDKAEKMGAVYAGIEFASGGATRLLGKVMPVGGLAKLEKLLPEHLRGPFAKIVLALFGETLEEGAQQVPSDSMHNAAVQIENTHLPIAEKKQLITATEMAVNAMNTFWQSAPAVALAFGGPVTLSTVIEKLTEKPKEGPLSEPPQAQPPPLPGEKSPIQPLPTAETGRTKGAKPGTQDIHIKMSDQPIAGESDFVKRRIEALREQAKDEDWPETLTQKAELAILRAETATTQEESDAADALAEEAQQDYVKWRETAAEPPVSHKVPRSAIPEAEGIPTGERQPAKPVATGTGSVAAELAAAEAKAGASPKATGQVELYGQKVTIETPKGERRKPGWPPLKDSYGRIQRTKGADGEPIDVFINRDRPESDKVYVIDQLDPKTGEFDENKVVMGATSPSEARRIYERNYDPGWKGFGGIHEFTVEEFKAWAASDKPRKSKGITITAPPVATPERKQAAPPAPAAAEARTIARPVKKEKSAEPPPTAAKPKVLKSLAELTPESISKPERSEPSQTAAIAPAKEPWQMTQGEYVATQDKLPLGQGLPSYNYKKAIDKAVGKSGTPEFEKSYDAEIRKLRDEHSKWSHGDFVKRAIAEGKPVPPEVLASVKKVPFNTPAGEQAAEPGVTLQAARKTPLAETEIAAEDQRAIEGIASAVAAMEPGIGAANIDGNEATKDIGSSPETPYYVGKVVAWRDQDGTWHAKSAISDQYITLKGRASYQTLARMLEARREASRAETTAPSEEVPFSTNRSPDANRPEGADASVEQSGVHRRDATNDRGAPQPSEIRSGSERQGGISEPNRQEVSISAARRDREKKHVAVPAPALTMAEAREKIRTLKNAIRGNPRLPARLRAKADSMRLDTAAQTSTDDIYAAIRDLLSAVGVRAVFVINQPTNGAVLPSDPNLMYLATRHDDGSSVEAPVLVTSAHELVESLHVRFPDLFERLDKFVMDEVKDWETWKAKASSWWGTTDNVMLRKEMVADALGEIFADPTMRKRFFARLQKQEPTLLQRILEFLTRLRDALFALHPDYKVSQHFDDFNLLIDELADFVAATRREDGRTWVAFSPEQVKSADPVTFDDAGNPIPLSQRFNPQTPDIRFSKERITERAAAPAIADIEAAMAAAEADIPPGRKEHRFSRRMREITTVLHQIKDKPTRPSEPDRWITFFTQRYKELHGRYDYATVPGGFINEMARIALEALSNYKTNADAENDLTHGQKWQLVENQQTRAAALTVLSQDYYLMGIEADRQGAHAERDQLYEASIRVKKFLQKHSHLRAAREINISKLNRMHFANHRAAEMELFQMLDQLHSEKLEDAAEAIAIIRNVAKNVKQDVAEEVTRIVEADPEVVANLKRLVIELDKKWRAQLARDRINAAELIKDVFPRAAWKNNADIKRRIDAYNKATDASTAKLKAQLSQPKAAFSPQRGEDLLPNIMPDDIADPLVHELVRGIISGKMNRTVGGRMEVALDGAALRTYLVGVFGEEAIDRLHDQYDIRPIFDRAVYEAGLFVKSNMTSIKKVGPRRRTGKISAETISFTEGDLFAAENIALVSGAVTQRPVDSIIKHESMSIETITDEEAREMMEEMEDVAGIDIAAIRNKAASPKAEAMLLWEHMAEHPEKYAKEMKAIEELRFRQLLEKKVGDCFNLEKLGDYWASLSPEQQRVWREMRVGALFESLGVNPREPGAVSYILDMKSVDLLKPKVIHALIKQQAEQQGTTLRKLIMGHYTQRGRAVAELTQRLREQMGWTPFAARLMARHIDEAMQKFFEAEKAKIAKTYTNQLKKAAKGSRAWRIAKDLLEQASLGLLTDEKVRTAWAEAAGLPTMTPEMLAKDYELVEKIIHANKNLTEWEASDAMQDLLEYRMQVMPRRIWPQIMQNMYFNTLGGITDDARNIVYSTFLNLVRMAAYDITHPKAFAASLFSMFSGSSLRMAAGQFATAMMGRPVAKHPGKIDFPRFVKYDTRFWRAYAKIRTIYSARPLVAEDVFQYVHTLAHYAERIAIGRMLREGKSMIRAAREANDMIYGTRAQQRNWKRESERRHPGKTLKAIIARARTYHELWLHNIPPEFADEAAELAATSMSTAEFPEGSVGQKLHKLASRVGAMRGWRLLPVKVALTPAVLFARIGIWIHNHHLSGIPVVGGSPRYAKHWREDSPEGRAFRMHAALEGFGAAAFTASLYLDKTPGGGDDDDQEKFINRLNSQFWICGFGPRDPAMRKYLTDRGWRHSPYTLKVSANGGTSLTRSCRRSDTFWRWLA